MTTQLQEAIDTLSKSIDHERLFSDEAAAVDTVLTALEQAISALDSYLNACTKEQRREAAGKAKLVYEQYYGTPYLNYRDRPSSTSSS